MSRPRFRLLLTGLPAIVLAAAAQALTPPTTAVEPLLATAQPGDGQVLSATVATPTPAPPTLAPTPDPTPAPTAPPAPRAAARTPVPAPPPPPAPPRNHLASADGRLDTGVGVYSDCGGTTALSHAYAAIDTCVGGRTYFVGHNPGVFTPLLSETIGSVITWWDSSGAAHPLRIVARRDWARADGVPPMVSGAVVAQFQTCLVSDGSEDLILDAVPA
ncbi:MAG TPA: hypothetical protein VFC09_04475 [Candidatus Dormibacteraeota bacterium]|nr:hypothetical protein [Candidatus Dormibacteraeota bacterium]